MRDTDLLIGTLLEDACLTLEELARLTAVPSEWIVRHVEAGRLAAACGASAVEWRFTSLALKRARRLHALERDYDADPELAALVADLLEELDRLRAGRG